ncbi:MAG: HU family DNA-binding protein [Bacteroidales bacterium]|nr:HU family DNA-binding protein [Bacteroidales bacterium]
MNNKDFITKLAQKEGLTMRDTQMLVNHLVAELTSTFEDGNILSIDGFGQFEVKKRLERVAISPSTGQKMLVPPKLVLGFKQSASLKERVQKGGNS